MKGQPLAKRKARKARNNTAPSSLLTLRHYDGRNEMPIDIGDIQTLEHLREYIQERLLGSTVVLDGDEVIIRTGMGIDLGNILYPLNEEE